MNAGRTSGPHAPGRGEDRPRRGVDARLSETSLARGQDAVGEDGDEEILHVVGPLILLAEVLFAPQRRRLGWGTLGVIVTFPIAWCAYTLIRANFIIAPATGLPYWYPYPFLNPHNFDAGYGVVALYIIGIAAAIIAIGAGVVWVSRKRGH